MLCVHCLVAFAQRFFPMEAQVAMEIAQVKGTCEFIGSSLEPDRLEEHKSRLKALSRTGMDSHPLHLLLYQQRREQNDPSLNMVMSLAV